MTTETNSEQLNLRASLLPLDLYYKTTSTVRPLDLGGFISSCIGTTNIAEVYSTDLLTSTKHSDS